MFVIISVSYTEEQEGKDRAAFIYDYWLWTELIGGRLPGRLVTPRTSAAHSEGAASDGYIRLLRILRSLQNYESQKGVASTPLQRIDSE